MIFGTGSQRIREAMNFWETPRDAYYSLRNDCEKMGIGVICCDSNEYPVLLKHIYDPPAVLYYKGDISCLKSRKKVTAVGTRKASDYGLRSAHTICRELAENGVVIVSGFALGTDITAHMAAAEAGFPTICVLGCGVDVDYPRGNFGFRDRIISNGGLFISEYPPGTEPHGYNFPKRNRILSALSQAVIVFEASIRSGSLVTASIAAEQGREVFCLPPADIFGDRFSGNVRLLSEGAIPLLGSRDVLAEINRQSSMELYDIRSSDGLWYPSERAAFASGKRSAKKKKSREVKPPEKKDLYENNISETEKAAENNETPAKKAFTLPDGLSDKQKSIAEMLKDCELHADVLSQRLELDAGELMTELTELEMLGVVRALPGKIYTLYDNQTVRG